MVEQHNKNNEKITEVINGSVDREAHQNKMWPSEWQEQSIWAEKWQKFSKGKDIGWKQEEQCLAYNFFWLSEKDVISRILKKKYNPRIVCSIQPSLMWEIKIFSDIHRQNHL